MDPRILTENGYKTASVKCKIKDNDLQKALACYDKLKDDEHAELLAGIAEIKATALTLKKSKELANNPAAAKYLTDLLAAADAEQREVSKDKAQTEKHEKEGDGGEDEDLDFQAALLAACKKLCGSKGLVYEYVICEGKPHPAVMMAKRITPKHKAQLAEVTGNKRFPHTGQCRAENGKLVFEMDKPVPGLATRVKNGIKEHTGKVYGVQVCGPGGAVDADGDTEGAHHDAAKPGEPKRPEHTQPSAGGGEDAAAKGVEAATKEAGDAASAPETESKVDMTGPLSISGSVGRGGKNKKEDVENVQAALNKRGGAKLDVDGKVGSKTIEAIVAFQKKMGFGMPDGIIEPGKETMRALNGEKVELSETVRNAKPGGTPKGPGVATSAEAGAKGAAAGKGTTGGTVGEAVGRIVAAAMKEAQEAEARRNAAEKAAVEVAEKIAKAIAQMVGSATGSEGEKIKKELEDAYKDIQKHAKAIQDALAELAKRKTEEEAKKVQKLLETIVPGFKAAEEQAAKARKWLESNVPGFLKDAQDLAKKVTKEIADKKKEAEKAYNEAMEKLKKAADEELGPEGRKIKDELEKAYKDNQEHIKNVAQAASELAKRKSAEAAEVLKKAAETANPQIKVVEDLAKKAIQWWNED